MFIPVPDPLLPTFQPFLYSFLVVLSDGLHASIYYNINNSSTYTCTEFRRSSYNAHLLHAYYMQHHHLCMQYVQSKKLIINKQAQLVDASAKCIEGVIAS